MMPGVGLRKRSAETSCSGLSLSRSAEAKERSCDGSKSVDLIPSSDDIRAPTGVLFLAIEKGVPECQISILRTSFL